MVSGMGRRMSIVSVERMSIYWASPKVKRAWTAASALLLLKSCCNHRGIAYNNRSPLTNSRQSNIK